jgi:hypothetical protein
MEVEQYLYDSVSIDDLSMEDEFKRVAADLAYWGARYAEAVKAHLLAKLEAEQAWARCWGQVKSNDTERVTDKAAEAKVTLNPVWKAVRVDEITAESEKLRAKAFVDAVSAKMHALQSLGAKMRVEMEGDPVIRRQERDRRRYGSGLNED